MLGTAIKFLKLVILEKFKTTHLGAQDGATERACIAMPGSRPTYEVLKWKYTM